jgi:hypothetical protein
MFRSRLRRRSRGMSTSNWRAPAVSATRFGACIRGKRRRPRCVGTRSSNRASSSTPDRRRDGARRSQRSAEWVWRQRSQGQLPTSGFDEQCLAGVSGVPPPRECGSARDAAAGPSDAWVGVVEVGATAAGAVRRKRKCASVEMRDNGRRQSGVGTSLRALRRSCAILYLYRELTSYGVRRRSPDWRPAGRTQIP